MISKKKINQTSSLWAKKKAVNNFYISNFVCLKSNRPIINVLNNIIIDVNAHLDIKYDFPGNRLIT